MDDHICWIDDTLCEDCSVDYIPLDGLDMTELDDGTVIVIDEEATPCTGCGIASGALPNVACMCFEEEA